MCSHAQSLDHSKPNWTLRVVCEQSDAECVEVRKDTDRLEEIRAMKQAWETADPGRALKVTHTHHTPVLTDTDTRFISHTRPWPLSR